VVSVVPLLHTGEYGLLDWSLHIDALLLCGVLLGGYFYAIRWLRPKVSDAGRVKRPQIIYYTLGVAVIYLAAGSPLHDLAEQRLLSAHMFQHVLFTMVAPPLLLAGTPGWLARWLLKSTGLTAVTRFLTRPVAALIVFNAILVVTHLTLPVDLALRYHALHFFVHVVLVASALILWWPVLSPMPEIPRLSYPFQMAYLFTQSLLPVIVASFITFADRPVYRFYAEAPELWGISAVEDQQIAGGVMKVLGSLILWGFITWAFYRWYTGERAKEREPYWEDVQTELEEMGISPRH
jgi:putative membrane protein